ncbi:hypothetical protein SERLADRAFT_475470 [Serpula lacrymans var. lacrymans S7.9]|nr:uncharacterized protein SERLADRAFT_475470 [Serpula lacrymans var. lacrymans S7.9]EGO20969.1 hypothetical protein SERLADRAFT_475470 [Serpula lacrymans var. lacrymans S7.9]
MRGISRWYEWREAIAVTESNALGANGQVTLKPYVAPIVETCNKIQGTFLRTVDPALYKSMQSAGIEPQIYGIRWLRLLFTREFPMHDAMALWDGLFSCVSSIADTTEWICVAMLIRIRNKLIPSDYSTQLTYLLRYPPTEEGSLNHIILLLRQAAALEMTRTPSTGASLVVENRNILNIPVDIPDPPMGRRRPRPGERGHQVSPSEGHFQGITGAHGENIRSPSHQMGIPELLARGLLDRGESLGINKTFMNAVSELKRNLPDLAASLVRTPSASSASYAAYPLLDERPQEERPSWEPRSRFEMEREVSEMRQLNKRLGESVGWIVDVLLQDEDGIEDAQQLSTIQNKKREALESLSYVRDVLNSGVSNVEEDRLWGADEYKRREEKYQAEASENEGREESSQLNVPRSAPDPVTLPLSNAADNSRKFDNKFASFPRDNRRFSPNTSSATPSSTRGFMRPPGFPLSSKTPPNLVPNTSTSLAPWSYPWTQAPVGSSSGGHSPNTVHPSIPVPPREVTRPLVGLHSYRTANSIIGTHQVADKVADQSPKTQDTTEVQHDPLGVLR